MIREDELFGEALDLPAPARAALLDRACDGDSTLRARIEALLAAHDTAGDFLETPPVVRAILGADEGPGDTIDRYTLLEKIGEGGWGVVYLAEQTTPVRRRVALKILKLGMDTRQVIARFESERQALALMDHPDIARVFDMGATDSGRPFFVMEFVDGIPITKFCDQHRLSLPQRLELFTRVGLALQHAHRKGIIHRDVKPSNVLVALHDGVPAPKVIDFGIAKATQERLTAETLVTGLGQIVGTPAYMSPEQADLREPDIDTRSDIYALGVLLYELLTGRPPFDPKQLALGGVEHLRRTIRETEPLRPSERITRLAPLERAEIARLRRTTAPQLSAALRRDLDWIVLRCLEKERDRRYGTAQELADDVRRHLREEPVLARPPSTGYRVRKFIARHRVACASAAAIAATLIAGTIVSVRQAIRATRAEQSARAQRDAAQSAQREEARARDDAQRRQQQAEDLLAFMLGDFRTELQKIGRLELLDAVGAKALAYFAELNPRDLTDPALVRQAQALTQIGEIRMEQARYAEAADAFSAAYARAAELVSRHPENGDMLFERAQAEYWIGFVARRRGDPDAERAWLTRYRDSALALAVLENNSPRARTEVTYGHHNLAVLEFDRGNLAAARAGFLAEQAALAELISASPADPELRFSLADTASWLGSTAERDGRYADALAHFTEMSSLAERQLDAEPTVPRWRVQLAQSHTLAGIAQSLLGRQAEALASHEKAEALLGPLVAQDPANKEWQLLLHRARLLRLSLLVATNPAAAAPLLAETRRKLEDLAAGEPSSRMFADHLATAWRLESRLLAAAQPALAAEAISRAVELDERTLTGKNADVWAISGTAQSHLLAGRLAWSRGEPDVARRHWNRAIEVLEPRLPGSNDWRFLDPAMQAFSLLGDAAQARLFAERLQQFEYRPIDRVAASTLEAALKTSTPTHNQIPAP